MIDPDDRPTLATGPVAPEVHDQPHFPGFGAARNAAGGRLHSTACPGMSPPGQEPATSAIRTTGGEGAHLDGQELWGLSGKKLLEAFEDSFSFLGSGSPFGRRPLGFFRSTVQLYQLGSHPG